MKYRTLPGTDLHVSHVCLGTMTWGEQNSESDAQAQLDYAMDQGINFIDTAEMYPVPPNATTQGRTETMLGRWLARRGRDKLVIATKVAGPGRRDWIRGGRTDLTRDVIVEAADTSLARLKLDRIDLFQIHWPQRNVPMFGATEFDPAKERQGPPIREQVEGMAALIKAGKIRHYGLSNETAWGVCEFRRVARELGVPGPVTIQNSYSLVSRGVDNDLAEVLFREEMSLLAYSPLAGGMLSGKYRNAAKPDNSRFTLFDGIGVRFRRPMVQRDRRVRRHRRGVRRDACRARARLREEPLVRRGDDHRRDIADAARGGHRGRAMRPRRGHARGDRRRAGAVSESGGLTRRFRARTDRTPAGIAPVPSTGRGGGRPRGRD
jgi:aryl-alcohol dehydrogenase (NADP+)